MIKIILTTQDNVKIIGDYYEGTSDNAPAVILLHMMPATKESWRDFAPVLVERGFQVLALDERGHGESVFRQKQDGTYEKLDYTAFTNEQIQEKKLDILTARKFFLDKGVSIENIFVGGASIGANLSLQYLSETPEAKAVFALSPGFDYYGVKTKQIMARIGGNQAVYLTAAKDDTRVADSYKAVETLAQIGGSAKETKIFDTGGHGTNIFKAHPEFMEELANWLSGFLRRR